MKMLSPRRAFRLLLLVTLCLSTLVAAHAQAATATLSGRVVDQNAAVVAGANVTATNTATGMQRQAQTSDDGVFTIPLLPPSTYILLVAREGFATAKVDDVVLNVGDQKALRIELKAGEVTEIVQVTGEVALIDESPAVGTVVDRQFVENLPLNGRSFQSLIALTPGVVLTTTNSDSQGQFSVNGQRANGNYFTVDGVSANIGVSTARNLGQTSGGQLPGLSASGGTNALVSVDALEEFRIQTSTYAPEFGRQPGGQVSIITRSGTDNLHGTLFEYFRNDALDANDWFNNAFRLPKPKLRQNDFGGVLGGPIVKKRLFFFFSYEGLRLTLPRTRIVSVPSAAARQAAPAQLRPFLNAFPQPNGPDLIGANGQPNGLAQLTGSFSDPSELHATSIRVDYTLNQKVSLFGRYNYSPSNTTTRGSVGSLNSSFRSAVNVQTTTIGSTQILSSRLTNEVRANYSSTVGRGDDLIDDFGGAIPLDDAAILPSFASRETSRYLFGLGSGIQYFVGKNVENRQRQFNLIDNLWFQTGNHQLKFGVDYRRLIPFYGARTYDLFANFRGIGMGVATPPVGSVLSGRASSVSVTSRLPVSVLISNFAAYAQDTWKIVPRMTITYGVRWDVNPAPKGRDGNDLLTLQGLDNLATATQAPDGTALYKTTYGNFAPRVGIAYQVFSGSGRETMLRGGFGIFYDLGSGVTADGAVNFPYSNRRSFTNIAYPLDPSLLSPPSLPATYPISNFNFMVVADPQLKLPRTFQWNLSLEQSLGVNQVLSASYVGAAGRELLRQEQVLGGALNSNPLFVPSAAFLEVTRNQASSDYHAMQLQFRRRLSRGLQALASYTWSHSIDNASTDSFFSGVPADQLDVKSDRGDSDFDVRHAFSGAVSYDIPTPHLGPFGSFILHNWSVQGIFRAQTATPVNVFNSFVIVSQVESVRPDLIQGVPLYITDPSVGGGKRINANAFALPPSDADGNALRQGNLGRNALRASIRNLVCSPRFPSSWKKLLRTASDLIIGPSTSRLIPTLHSRQTP